MNESKLREILSHLLAAYADRDQNVEFSDWLAEELRQELPEIGEEAGVKLAGDIIEAVAGYDQTLHDLNQAIEAGQSKEEWLAEQLEEAYDGMPLDAVGGSLQRMEAELVASNMQLMDETGSLVVEEEPVEAEPVEWNKYSVKAKAYGIGQQLNALALCAAAGALERKVNGEEIAVGDVVADVLQNGLNASPSEVKAVVAGAVQVAAEKGLTDILPPDTPVEVIGDFAGVAVEGAKALYDAANGDITMTEAVDQVGRAGVAAGCRIGAGLLKDFVIGLPYGPLLVDLLGGLFEHMESPQFINNVYTTVRAAAIATWEGIMRSNVVKEAKKLFERTKQKFLS